MTLISNHCFGKNETVQLSEATCDGIL